MTDTLEIFIYAWYIWNHVLMSRRKFLSRSPFFKIHETSYKLFKNEVFVFTLKASIHLCYACLCHGVCPRTAIEDYTQSRPVCSSSNGFPIVERCRARSVALMKKIDLPTPQWGLKNEAKRNLWPTFLLIIYY